MSREGLEKFLKLMTEDDDCRGHSKSVSGDPRALADYARERGCDVTPEELSEIREKSLALMKSRVNRSQGAQAAPSPGARQFYALLELAETDDEVNRKMEQLSDGTTSELIAYGREKGFIFDEEDLLAVGKDILESSEELSEEELELVSGGTTVLVFLLVLGFGAFVVGVAAAAAGVAIALSKK